MNMKDMNVEALLYQAAPGANKLFLSEFPEPENCHYSVSRKFERKIGHLLKQQNKPVLYWIQRSIACFLAIILLGCSSVLVFSTEARAAFRGWMREVLETCYVYTFSGEKLNEPIESTFTPQWLPEGYHIMERYSLESYSSNVYVNQDGHKISINYIRNSATSIFQIEKENAEIISTSVLEHPATFYLDSNMGENILVWIDSENEIMFWIQGTLNLNTIVKIAENLNN